ncbi:hypothetical protein ECP030526011_3218 [Escherichia coli P0305260.11]|nr:hypothetical protein ECP03052602_3242 [Escherichia coli P0305260.2]ENF81558.1 hypothetical protein ECP030526011_3218 [Escherichia coli P0305260.11]
MSDATLTRLIRPIAAARCVLDKVFSPHPAIRRDDIIYTPPGV